MSPTSVEIRDSVGVASARRAARDAALAIGFNENECEQIALAASELASNLVRHAGGGTLRVAAAEHGGIQGIRLETEDRGPGIAQPDRALTDGVSTAGGLGNGLGAVHRIMDELDLRPRPAGGLLVRCCRWKRPPDPGFPGPLDIGVSSRPRRLETHNGDAFTVRSWASGALVGVIDGLGHGEEAQRAALSARSYVDDHFDQSIRALFTGVAQVCRRTRGVVMALARFDFVASAVEVGSVGNVEVRVLGGAQRANVIIRRGILGVNAPPPVVTSHPWTDRTILVIHSDGLHSHWNLDSLPSPTWALPREAAQALLQALGKDDDDATVVVARSAAR